MAASGDPEKVDLASPDLAAAHREALEAAFPGVLADGVLDVPRLAELLDVEVAGVADGRERYGLMWAGKSEAVRSLLTPSRGTLVPDFDRSIDFDTAQNVFIEGDNLEVLKLLQKAYNDKVKLIYIDPPYNTGNDFVYNDDFSDGLRGYLEYTGQVDEDGNRTSANADTQGRRHSKWLSMMYPRLFIARNLLQANGVIFVSIDDHEMHNLRSVMDDIFGAECFVGSFIWRKKFTLSFRDEYQIAVHEYIVCYRGRGRPAIRDDRWRDEETVAVNPVFKSQNAESVKTFRRGSRLKGGVIGERFVIAQGLIDLPSQTIEYLSDAVFEDGVLLVDVDVRGRFACGQRRLDEDDVVVSKSGAAYIEGEQKQSDIRPISILFDYTKDDKEFLYSQYKARKSISTRQATAELEALMGAKVFDNPKPTELIRSLIAFVEMSDGDVVMDFFAGSGTTAHSVAIQNALDGIGRRSLSVNIPEPVGEVSRVAAAPGAAEFDDVADICFARIRTALDLIQDSGGLRVFQLAESAFRRPSAELGGELRLDPTTLAVERDDLALLATEIMLGEGRSLDAEWHRNQVEDTAVIVSDGVAVVLSVDIDQKIVDYVFGLDVMVVVFLEDGFAGKDALKANAVTNARNRGITMKTV